MNDLICQGRTALDYAKMACDTLMHKFSPEDLPPKGRFHYHQGVFLSGMQKTFHICREEKYAAYLKRWVDSIIDANGEIHTYDSGQLDDMQPGILLFDLYHQYHEKGDSRYKKALDHLADDLRGFPKNSEGGFWHKVKNKEQMWLDGLYMAGPLMARYGAEFGEPDWFDACAFQALMMREKTEDAKTGLYYHAWDSVRECPWADPKTGRSSEFWGRSIGWVPVAILDELDYFPADHPKREDLVKLTVDLLRAAARYQDLESGLWYQVVDKGGMEGNWLESSCTCLFAAAICKAVRMGYLESTYLDCARRAYEGIIGRLKYNEAGVVIDNVCVGTCVGDYAHYCARPTSENDLHGAGAFILMCQEVFLTFHQDE